MTRYERIQKLSPDDMASFLSELQWDSSEPTSQEMYEWLLEEYTRDDNDVLYAATDGLREQLRDINESDCFHVDAREIQHMLR